MWKCQIYLSILFWVHRENQFRIAKHVPVYEIQGPDFKHYIILLFCFVYAYYFIYPDNQHNVERSRSIKEENILLPGI